MREHERQVLRGLMESKDNWLYRAVIMSMVLQGLGYNTDTIFAVDKEVLRNYLGKTFIEIIHDLHLSEEEQVWARQEREGKCSGELASVGPTTPGAT